MKILVFSDSHGDSSTMCDIVSLCKKDTSLLIHLGDMCADFEMVKNFFPNIPFINVRGNNDFFETDIESDVQISLSGINTFITHGHRYGVKSGLSGISARARATRSDLVLFGHSHQPLKEKRGDILYINPGSVSSRSGKPTFSVLEIDNFLIQSAEILTYDKVRNSVDFLRVPRWSVPLKKTHF